MRKIAEKWKKNLLLAKGEEWFNQKMDQLRHCEKSSKKYQQAKEEEEEEWRRIYNFIRTHDYSETRISHFRLPTEASFT